MNIRRMLAGLTLATVLAAGAVLANDVLTPEADTTWGAPATTDDTRWDAPPADGAEPPLPPSTGSSITVTPLDTTWG